MSNVNATEGTKYEEGKVYSVELLTGKKIEVDETVNRRIMVLGGTTYVVGKKDANGHRKLRPLKSKIK
jgi:hypothetical protein